MGWLRLQWHLILIMDPAVVPAAVIPLRIAAAAVAPPVEVPEVQTMARDSLLKDPVPHIAPAEIIDSVRERKTSKAVRDLTTLRPDKTWSVCPMAVLPVTAASEG